jgi:hypothetical protein
MSRQGAGEVSIVTPPAASITSFGVVFLLTLALARISSRRSGAIGGAA